MRIDSFSITNFRCFEHIDITLHPQLNILVGVNGVGKTTILEALRIFLGSIFVEMNKVENKIYSPSILLEDVRLEHNEPQFSTVLTGDVTVPPYLQQPHREQYWGRALKTSKGNTIYENRPFIIRLSSTIQEKIQSGTLEAMPLVAYYSTNRYKREKRNTGLEADGSRLRGYYNALDTTTNVWFFLDVYKTATLARLQGRSGSLVIEAVHNAIVNLVPNCVNIWYDVQRDGLYIDTNDGQTVPFFSLSDGVRCMISMAFELALRCFILNPHLGLEAPRLTPGVILIDEIDLHLHPSWQRRVLTDLTQAFPSMQFVVTTHSPMVLHSVSDCKIISIANQNTYTFPSQYKRDITAILRDMDHNYSSDDCDQLLSTYRELIENGQGRTQRALEIRERLNRIMGPTHDELQRTDIMLQLYCE